MKDLNTEQTLTFKCNRWLFREEEDMDVWRELPVVNPGQQPLPGKMVALRVCSNHTDVLLNCILLH